jgi:hypothetical protein
MPYCIRHPFRLSITNIVREFSLCYYCPKMRLVSLSNRIVNVQLPFARTLILHRAREDHQAFQLPDRACCSIRQSAPWPPAAAYRSSQTPDACAEDVDTFMRQSIMTSICHGKTKYTTRQVLTAFRLLHSQSGWAREWACSCHRAIRSLPAPAKHFLQDWSTDDARIKTARSTREPLSCPRTVLVRRDLSATLKEQSVRVAEHGQRPGGTRVLR